MSGRLRIKSLGGGALIAEGCHASRSRPGWLDATFAADERALAAANVAVDNPWHAPVLELLAGPLTLVVEDTGVVLSVVGARFTVNGAASAEGVSVRAPIGAVVKVAACGPGLRAVVAVRGGFGDAGTLVRKGDVVDVVDAPVVRATPVAHDTNPGDVVRVVDGAEVALFDGGVAALAAHAWCVEPMSSRQGVRLSPVEGDSIKIGDVAMVTSPVWMGDVQVPPSGLPVVLGAASVMTGGYPRVARVIAVDVWRLGQLRPGQRVRFVRVDVAEARALRLAWHASLHTAP